MKRFVILAAISVLLIALSPIKSIKANDAEEGAQPAAEPYSFSYSAESTGGFSSREESGDASGRVQGFYIIMGDDQRERRVDYVADKDGYRATISTNEIGTRSQSSADAQYQARLPSKEQLDQAKTTLEEYKFLEQQHEAELQRHLNVQQTGQRQSNSNQNTQSWSALDTNRQQAGQAAQSGQFGQFGQSGQASWMSSSSSAQQPQQQRWSQSNQANANLLRLNQPQLQSQAQQQTQFEQVTNSTLASSTGQDDESWRSAKLLASNQQQKPRPKGTTETELATSVTEATSSPFVAPTGAGLRQQTSQQQQNNFQAPAWSQSSSDQGSFSASAQAPSSGGLDLGLQRQFKQQFMQQAQQLTAEDYPRNSRGQNQQVEPNRQVVATTTFNQQQQPQEELVAPQLPRWQQQANLVSDQRSQGQEALSQINQQQANVIDEISGEQVEPNQQQIGGGGQFLRQEGAVTSTGQSDVTTSQLRPVPIQPRPEPQQQQPQQQSYKNYEETTTTTKRPAPSGFLAIDLGRQEVELKQETPGPSYQTTTLANQRVEVDQLVGGDVQQQQDGGQTTDYQQQQFQVDQRQEQQQPQPQPQRPESIQQIIQSGGTKQKQQQMVFVRPTIAATQQPTTTQARQEPELTTTFQPTVTTTTTSSTTRAPQVETTALITTTSTNSQTYSSFAPSSAGPAERFSTGLLEQTTRKPAFVRQQQPQQQQQQQWVNKGNKGGVQGARRVTIGPKFMQNKPAEQPLVETPSIPTSTTREQFSTTRGPNSLAQSIGTSQQPELIVSGQQTTQQVPYQSSFNTKQRQSGPTSERTTTSTTSATALPVQSFDTSTPQEAPYRPQSQQPKPEPRQPIPQQPQWTGGVKGASKTGANKRQFWQQSNAAISNNQRASSLQASNQVATQNSQASVDYAPQTREFGSRIQGRSN